jgi:hypothetical protein
MPVRVIFASPVVEEKVAAAAVVVEVVGAACVNPFVSLWIVSS